MSVAVDQPGNYQPFSSINDCSTWGRGDSRRRNGLYPALVDQDIGRGCGRCLSIQNPAVGDEGKRHSRIQILTGNGLSVELGSSLSSRTGDCLARSPTIDRDSLAGYGRITGQEQHGR